MPTLRSAAALLAAARDARSLVPIAALIGCRGAPSPLDAEARAALGIQSGFSHATVAPGPGALRAILLDGRGLGPLRDSLPRLARRLSARAPHQLWIAIACDRVTGEVAIAAWEPGRNGPRVAALVTDRANVVESDAETLCALAAAGEPIDVLTHARWVTILGREAVTRRFYGALERLVLALATGARGSAPHAARRDLALLQVSRLLFLSFLEAKGWLDRDRAFLLRQYDACVSTIGGFHRRVLQPLFFGTLNTMPANRARAARALGRIPFLNGGLFARSPLERAHPSLEMRDEELGRLFSELLGRYRFTAREETVDWSEAAVDPEMLGRAFESLMARGERRTSGAFFTPHELVARVCDGALRESLADVARADLVERALGGERLSAAGADAIVRRLRTLRLLDPACGSGAFLVHALERIAGLLQSLGDERPLPEVRRAVLATSIFGVDVNPTAVWLCELRLWLSVVIESDECDPLRVPPLPNLDRHIRVGDALAGGDFASGLVAPGGRRSMRTLRQRYARASGARKRTLARALDRAERSHAIAGLERRIAIATATRRDLLAAARTRDLFGERGPPSRARRGELAALRTELRECRAARRSLLAGGALPFSFAAQFADVGASGGFDVVVGNPPWVRLHRIAPAARETLRRTFRVYRDAAWRAGASAARAGLGFAGQVDLAALFVERSLALARPAGTVALLVPAKLWRSLAGGGVRRLVVAEHALRAVEDWSDAPALFAAAVYPSAVLIRRRGPGASQALVGASDGSAGGAARPPGDPVDERHRPPPSDGVPTRVTIHARRISVDWCTTPDALGLEATPGAPWLLLPPQARRAFEAVRAAGSPLAETAFGSPLLGVKCGCNDAFVLRVEEARSLVEPSLLRPVLRGEGVARWRCEPNEELIVWPHGDDGLPLEKLPDAAARHLRAWRRRLAARADARGRGRWWALFRTEGAAADVARVVWSDFGRTPRVAVLPAGDPTVPLNSCYVLRAREPSDAYALAALLNSPLAAAWLDPLAEPARGGYRRYLGWTVALFPIPAEWTRARALLAPLGERASAGEEVSEQELLEGALHAYRLSLAVITPLLDWIRR